MKYHVVCTFCTLSCYTIVHVLHCMHNFVRRENRIMYASTAVGRASYRRFFQKNHKHKTSCYIAPGTTLSWITLHDGSQHWHHHDHQYWHSIGAAPALTLAHSLAQHDHKLMINTKVFVTIFVCLFFLVPCCGFPTEKYARMDDWHYHLETTDNWEDFPGGGGGGLTYSNEML